MIEVVVKQDFNLDLPYGIAVQRITIKPDKLNVAIRDSRDDNVPVNVLRDMAAKMIAKEILNKLTYHNYLIDYGRTKVHEFSIEDCTTVESEQNKQIIEGLTRDLQWEIKLNSILTEKYTKLCVVFNYNNRSLKTKLVDWLLYDRPFRKELKGGTRI